MRYLYIAGACGSIGTQTLDIVRENKNEFKVIGMSVGKNKELAIKLIEEFKPEIVCFREGYAYDLSYNPKIGFGDSGLLELASYSKYPDEVFVNALVAIFMSGFAFSFAIAMLITNAFGAITSLLIMLWFSRMYLKINNVKGERLNFFKGDNVDEIKTK